MSHYENTSDSSYKLIIGCLRKDVSPIKNFFSNWPKDLSLTTFICHNFGLSFSEEIYAHLKATQSRCVVRVNSESKIENGKIYVCTGVARIFENSNQHRVIRMSGFVNSEYSIDKFITQISHFYRKNLIGVMFAGASKDGYRGCRDLQSKNGIFLAEKKVIESRFSSFNYRIFEFADKILSVHEMPLYIRAYVNSCKGDKNDLQVKELETRKPEKDFTLILEELSKYKGIDFLKYKKPTLYRRIEQRIYELNLDSSFAYLKLLQSSESEKSYLHEGVLIGLTSFFRDTEPFKALKKLVLDSLLKLDCEQTLRIWIVGCSSGEEVYSIAMLLHFLAEKTGKVWRFRIFATDVSEESIKVAAKGLFDQNKVQNIPKSFLDRYFVKTDNGFKIESFIRKSILFSVHNCVKDPPFTKLDLISCRNTLIYFDRELQKQALNCFHFGLRKNGFLFLGASESVGKMNKYFDVIDATNRIFVKNSEVKLTPMEVSPMRIETKKNRDSKQSLLDKIAGKQQDRDKNSSFKPFVSSSTLKDICQAFFPDCIVLDQSLRIYGVYGKACSLLEIPYGRLELNSDKLLNPRLRVALNLGLMKWSILKRQIKVKNVSFKNSLEQEKIVNIILHPFGNDDSRVFLVEFENLELPPAGSHQDLPHEICLKSNMDDKTEKIFRRD